MAEQAAISVLDYPENVRFRKGMYINSPNHALFEIVDNATDEFSAGHADTIKVTFRGDRASVLDNGAGIPITPHKDPRFKGISSAEVAMTTLHAGGKFGAGSSGYKTNTSGLNG